MKLGRAPATNSSLIGVFMGVALSLNGAGVLFDNFDDMFDYGGQRRRRHRSEGRADAERHPYRAARIIDSVADLVDELG